MNSDPEKDIFIMLGVDTMKVRVYWINEHAVEQNCYLNCDECVIDRFGVSIYWGTWFCCHHLYVRWDEFPEYTFSLEKES